MRTKFALPTVLLALVLLSGLAIQSAIGGPDIKIDIGPGLTPSISWTPPDLDITAIRVHEGLYKPGEPFDRDQVMWWVEATGGNALHPQMFYGAAVPEARTIQQSRDLVAGRTYTVYIYQSDESFSGDRNIYEATETFIAGK